MTHLLILYYFMNMYDKEDACCVKQGYTKKKVQIETKELTIYKFVCVYTFTFFFKGEIQNFEISAHIHIIFT